MNAGTLETLEVNLPPMLEQQKIAEILTCADTLIFKYRRLIHLKELQFRELQRRLIFGHLNKKRNSGAKDVELLPLSEFLKENSRPVPKPTTPYLGLGLRSHGKGTFLKHDSEPEKIDLDYLFQVRANDLIVNITFAWEGAIAIASMEDDGALTSHRFPTYSVDQKIILLDFLKYVIRQKRMVYDLGFKSPGGAGRNRVLSKSGFLEIEVPVPSISKQTKIVEVLNTQEQQIGYLTKLLTCSENQRRGLMQKLLTGKVRVKV